MKTRKLPPHEWNRRSFLKKASLILASSGLAPLTRLEVFNSFSNLILPMAHAQSGSHPVDFFLNICLRQAYCIGSLFPPPQFASSETGATRGIIWRSSYRRGTNAGDHPVYFSEGAYDNGGVSLENFANYMAFFECMKDNFYNGIGHSSIWPSQIGGFSINNKVPGGTVFPNTTTSLSPLFASESREIRQKNRLPKALVPGVTSLLYDMNGTTQSYNGGPELTKLTEETLSAAVPPVQTKLSKTESSLVVEAIKKINSIQEASSLRYRVSNAANAKLAAEQGLDLIMNTDAARFKDLYSDTLKTKFGVGKTMRNQDLGKALLLSYLGFRTGLVASAHVQFYANHTHRIIDLGTGEPDDNRADFSNDIKLHDKFMALRLGALLDELTTTDHPFRAGNKMIDHTLIMISSEGLRGLAYDDKGKEGWSDGERAGAMLIGGCVQPGYYGDAFLTKSGERGIHSFDPQTGRTNSNSERILEASVYKTVAEMLGVSEYVIRREMKGNYSAPSLAALKKT